MSSKLTLRDRLTKAHASIMRHPDFCLYSGVIMAGDTKILSGKESPIPTAGTDGLNVIYCGDWLETMNDKQIRTVVLHENLHKAFQHNSLYFGLHNKDAEVTAQAIDYFVNQIIKDGDPDWAFCEVPPCTAYPAPGAKFLQHDKYRGWGVKRIWDDLMQQKKQCQKNGPGKGQGKGDKTYQPGTGGLDDHIHSLMEQMTQAEREELRKAMEQALREGGNLQGMLKGNMNRQVQDFLEPKINWREALAEFVRSIAAGKDKSDWRRLNRRFLYQDIYLPSLVSERVGPIVVAIDTSGSIGERELSEFGGELASICQEVRPEKVTVLWWDTAVHGQQEFTEEEYDKIASLLKPAGGGGTMGSCVPPYLQKHDIHPECVIMFTDGYLESFSGWNGVPVLWLVTQNKDYVPGEGEVVEFDPDM
jgi:predicted metal-dependent peptidase